MPAWRKKASATVSRSGSAKGSASRSRKAKVFVAGAFGGQREQRRAVVHQAPVGLAGAVPFEHGELGMVQRTALAVAIDRAEAENPCFAGCEQFLAGEFRRGVQVERRARGVGQDRLRGEGRQMRLVARRDLEGRCLDLDEIALGEPVADRRRYGVALEQPRPPVGMSMGRPPGRGSSSSCLRAMLQRRASLTLTLSLDKDRPSAGSILGGVLGKPATPEAQRGAGLAAA